MNIVHIGKYTKPEEVGHIKTLRDAGHDVYVAGDTIAGEQLVRRIIDADEIHIFDTGMVFELGMVYFYSVHALHFKLGWDIRVFCDCGPGDKLLPLFMQQQQQFESGVNERPILLPCDDSQAQVCANPEFRMHAGCGKCAKRSEDDD